jgi:hypothetical protein
MSGAFSKLNIHSMRQQMKQCVYGIQYDNSWCYASEKRPLKRALRNKNITWKKINLTHVWRKPQNMLERSKGLVHWTHLQVIQGIFPHLNSQHCCRSQKTKLQPVQNICESCVSCWYIQRICLFNDDLYSDGTSATIAVKQCMDTSVLPHVCEVPLFFKRLL